MAWCLWRESIGSNCLYPWCWISNGGPAPADPGLAPTPPGGACCRQGSEIAACCPLMGYVKSLYTWGAPAIHKGGNLPDPRKGDGCWEGLRVVNIATPDEGVWDSDIVSGVANIVGYWHPQMPTERVSNISEVYAYPCGVEGPRPVIGKVSLHGAGLYESKANLLNGDARTLTQYFVTSAYMETRDAAFYTVDAGYVLIGTAPWEGKETRLFLHPSTWHCIVSFQGTSSERLLDWWDNIRFYDTDFCGLQDSVHGGFRDQLRAIVDHPDFQYWITGKMRQCEDVSVIGHSLGGALAALYSYCLNAGPSGGEDYDRIKFTRMPRNTLQPGPRRRDYRRRDPAYHRRRN